MDINILSRLLGEQRLQAVDVGARGGMPNHWQAFASSIELNAFEPDAAACKVQQDAKRPNESWFPTALGPATGIGKLYVVNKASSSSLFPPNEMENARYDFAGNREVAKIIDVPLMTFSDFLDRYQRPLPNLVKLDTQGAELGILANLRQEHWRDLLAVQTEVTFIERYKGEPMFWEVDAAMRARGFIMFDLLPYRKYRTGGQRRHHYLRKYLGIARNRRDISCRVVAGDAFYLRPTEGLLERGDRIAVLKMLIILLIYRCLDEALWFTEEAGRRGILTATEAEEVFSLIRQRAPSPYPWQRDGKIGNIARKWLKRLGVSKRRPIEYWLDRSWDH